MAVSLQSDPAVIPTNSMALLSSLGPVFRALTADAVTPQALIQIESLGSYFTINGPLARSLPDHMHRSSSLRLNRLRTSIGWMAGDTASALSQTAGGQAAALLSLLLVEMTCRGSTGHMLYELSLKVLPVGSCLSSMVQLADVAEKLANKLQPLAFGRHHAQQLTRIRQTYLMSGIETGPSFNEGLLDRMTVEDMAQLLSYLQRALREATLILHIEGFRGLGAIVSMITALCPDDTLLAVEGGILFQGERQSVIISIMANRETSFSLETTVRDFRKEFTQKLDNSLSETEKTTACFKPNDRLNGMRQLSNFEYLGMKKEGALADSLEQLFLQFNIFIPTAKVERALVEFVTAVVYSFTGSDFGEGSMFPAGGLRSLLGNNSTDLVQKKLRVLFKCEPITVSLDYVEAYRNLRSAIHGVIPERACTCCLCFTNHIWTFELPEQFCIARSIWMGLQPLIGLAILCLFVNIDTDTVRIIQRPQIQIGRYICERVIRAVLQSDLDISICESQQSTAEVHKQEKAEPRKLTRTTEDLESSHFTNSGDSTENKETADFLGMTRLAKLTIAAFRDAVGYTKTEANVENKESSASIPWAKDVHTTNILKLPLTTVTTFSSISTTESTEIERPPPYSTLPPYKISTLHNDILNLQGTIVHNMGEGHNIIATSNGASSIYPVTLEHLSLDPSLALVYRISDGAFHDNRAYYKSILEDVVIEQRPFAKKSALVGSGRAGQKVPLEESRLGTHQDLTVSLRPWFNSLAMRVLVQSARRVFNLSFYSLHIASMGLTSARACDHNPATQVFLSDEILTTTVDAPLAEDEWDGGGKPDGGILSVVLVHGSPEAQLLAGVEGARSIFQGDSCLGCAVAEAQRGKFALLIQK